MFYEVKLKSFIRVPPSDFDKELDLAVIKQVREHYSGYVSKDFGFVIDVVSLDNVEDGVLIPGDGAVFYKSTFNLLVYLPEVQEVVLGKIKDITDFGAFLSVGPVEGMVHIGQTMNDFVSFSKDKALQGKESKRVLKVGDKCFARVVAVSFKDLSNPKIGLTMRQDGLGKIDWINDDLFKIASSKSPKKK